MARVKPRSGSKRRRSSSSGAEDAQETTEQQDEAISDEEQQYDDAGQLQNGAMSDSSYQPDGQQWQQQQLPEPAAVEQHVPQPRGRPRKRKPVRQSAEDGSAAEPAAKRTRGAGGRGMYREDDDDVELEYDFVSSSEEEEAADSHAGASEHDENESHCKVCGSDAEADKLLCCEHCPAVYHLYCLDPPLSRVPRGVWLCPLCSEADHVLEHMEKVLAVREVQQQQQDHDTAAASGKPRQEFYVKWRDRSYLHCSWIADDVINRAAAVRVIGQANPVVARLRKFWRDHAAAAESGELAEAEETGEQVNGINPAWTKVDRVLAERHVRGGSDEAGLEYLVAWKELPLDQASWESVQDLAEFSAEIAAYHGAKVPISAEAAQRAQQQKAEAKTAKAAQHAAAELAEDMDDTTAAATGERGAGTRKFETTPDFVAGGPLHPYQLEGLNWLYHKAQVGDNVILADEMGLGKTIQTIAFLGALWKDCVKLPHLVVVPLTTLNNWERELATWAPYLTVVSLHGSAAARQLLLEHCMYAPSEPGQGRGRAALQERVKFHVLLTTYEMVSKHLADIRKLDWAALVVDEAHRLKNATSRLFQDLTRVTAQHRLLLTGTPLQNNLEELFFLMNFLEPAKFPSVEVFKETYATLDDKDKVSELHRQLAPHLLRRLKKDVLKQLPPKMEQIVRVELSDEQKQLYKAILSKNYNALVDKSNSVVRLRNIMMELRKAVNHPCLLSFDLHTPAYLAAVARRQAAAAAAAAAAAQGGVSGPRVSEDTEQLVAASGKLALLDKMMLRLRAGGHRVLIYSQFTRTLDVLEDWIVGRGWGYERIDGDVSGLDRQKRVDSFNNNSSGNKFVFLLSTRAGGLGINLATADTVVIYDSDWNPHNDLQALARAHRMGQRRSVMVFRLVARATVEERMLQRAKSKLVLEHLVVAKAAKSDKLAQAELDDILRYGAKEMFAEDEEEQQEQQHTDAAETVAAVGEASDAAAAADQQQQDAGGVTVSKQAPKSNMKIVWDDAAIERLLDRSQVEAAAAAAGDEEREDDEFTKAFKVANFDMVVDEGNAELEQQQAAAAGAQEGQAAAAAADGTTTAVPGEDGLMEYDPAATELHKSQQAFWAAILGASAAADDATAAGNGVDPLAAAEAQLGRRRARTTARYIYYDTESETDSDGSDSGSGEGEQQEGDDSAAAPKHKRGRRRKRKPEDDDVEYQALEEQASDSEEIVDDADHQIVDTLGLSAGSDAAMMPAAAVVAAAAAALPPPAADKAAKERDRNLPAPQADTLAAERAAAAAVVAAAYGKQRPLAAAVQPAAAAAAASPAAATGVQAEPGPEQQQPHQEVLPPRVQGSGPNLLICGFTSVERTAFVNAMMHFGPPFIHRQPELGWAPYQQAIPGKSKTQLASYLLVLLEHLQDIASDPASTHGSYDYLPHTLFFVGLRGQISPFKIWERLTALHLLAMKLWAHGAKPPAAFVVSGADGGPAGTGGKGRAGGAPLYRQLSSRPGGWGPAQDFELVRGIFLAGYDCWLKVLSLPAMSTMRKALRIEVNLPVDYDSRDAAAEVAAPGQPAASKDEQQQDAILKQYAHQKQVSTYKKKEVDWLDRRAKHLVTALRQEYEMERHQRPKQQQPPPQQQQQRRQQQVPQQVQPPQAQRAVGGPGNAPTREQQAAAQRQAAQLAAQQERLRVQQQQGAPVSATGSSAPAGAKWRNDAVNIYQGMRAQLQRIKQEASSAMRSDRPDDPNAMQNAAEKFRASVKHLQQQAATLEVLLRSLLSPPQQQQQQQQRAPVQTGQQPRGPGPAPGLPLQQLQQPPRQGMPGPAQQQQQQQQRMQSGAMRAGMQAGAAHQQQRSVTSAAATPQQQQQAMMLRQQQPLPTHHQPPPQLPPQPQRPQVTTAAPGMQLQRQQVSQAPPQQQQPPQPGASAVAATGTAVPVKQSGSPEVIIID